MKKTYAKSGNTCRVTFSLPKDVEAKEVALLGEFNEWDPDKHPLKKRKDGRFSVTVSLPAGKEYRFRYLLDGGTLGERLERRQVHRQRARRGRFGDRSLGRPAFSTGYGKAGEEPAFNVLFRATCPGRELP